MGHSVDDVRKHYEGLAFGSFCYADRRAGFYPLIEEFLAQVGPHERVCDVGCGAGFWLDEFVRRGLREDQVFGVDLAPAHVADVRRRGHRAEVADVTNLTFANESIDHTFCSGVIHHTPDPARALSELARVTWRGGLIYLVVYNRWHPYFWAVHKATAPVRWFHWHGWRRVSNAGYRAWKLAVQPASYIVFGKALDEQTCRTLYMDQVLTPFAHLFTRRSIRRLANQTGLDVLQMRRALGSIVYVALLRVRPA